MTITISDMTLKDIKEWNTSFKRFRTDNDTEWNWYKIYALSAIMKVGGQETVNMVLRANNTIIGMAVVAFNYPCTLPHSAINRRRGCVVPSQGDSTLIPSFLWYINKAPIANKLEKAGEFSFGVGEQFFDEIVKRVQAAGSNSPFPFWLHADPSGGNGLFNYYLKKGFCQCDSSVKLSTLKFVRKNDARYMYYNTLRTKGVSNAY
ncbi:hypothetical protein ACXWTF_12685 [Thiomicrolovo sp. ZZH C-3]